MKQTWDRTRQHEQQALSESQQCLEADRESHTRRIEEDKATLIRDRSSLDDDRDRMQRENDSQRSHFDKTRCKMDALQDSLDARSREIEDAALAVSEQDALLKQQVVEQKLQEEQWLDALRVARKTVSRRGKQIARQEMETRKLRSLRDSLKTRRRGLESAARVYRCKLEEPRREGRFARCPTGRSRSTPPGFHGATSRTNRSCRNVAMPPWHSLTSWKGVSTNSRKPLPMRVILPKQVLASRPWKLNWIPLVVSLLMSNLPCRN